MSHKSASHEAFAVDPYTQSEKCFHCIGLLLNGSVTLGGLLWLCLTWQTYRPYWFWLVISLITSFYIGDLVSGLLHWAFDTWFDESTSFVRRMVLHVREHHIYPNRIFAIGICHHAGTLSWISLLLNGPVIIWAVFFSMPPSVLSYYVVCNAVVLSLLLVFMLEFHKCGHRSRNPTWVRILQISGLLLSVHHHLQHHMGNYDFNYCLINGWADRTLGRLGLFRLLERGIFFLSGIKPRLNDQQWLQRFGRLVVMK